MEPDTAPACREGGTGSQNSSHTLAQAMSREVAENRTRARPSEAAGPALRRPLTCTCPAPHPPAPSQAARGLVHTCGPHPHPAPRHGCPPGRHPRHTVSADAPGHQVRPSWQPRAPTIPQSPPPREDTSCLWETPPGRGLGHTVVQVRRASSSAPARSSREAHHADAEDGPPAPARAAAPSLWTS